MYLNAHSYFSFHYGVMSPRALLQEASGRGVKTLALTDINHTGACQDFVRMAPGYGVKPVVGADFRNPARGKKLDSGVANRPCFVALAKSNKGFFEINDYLSGYVHAKKLFPGRAPEFEEVAIVYPVETYSGWKLGKNEYLGVSADAINKLAFGKWKLSQDKLVILHAVTFRNVRDRNAHKLLQAIGDNTLLSKVDPARFGKESDVMLSPDDFRSTYSSLREIVKNTEELLDQCNIEFDFDKSTNHKNQTTYTGSDDEDFRLIRQLCEKGLSYRYDKPSQAVLGRLEKELNMIRQKGFVAYFLINWRIISYALSKGYFYVGRGSGANSIVAYLLRITDVDPIELDLYFERFINLYRSSPPDFDIDFSWHDREDITRFIFNEFKNVSLLGTYSTLQQRAVLREIGKVFGLPAHEIERVQDGRVAADDLDGLSRTVRKYGNVLKGLPSHMSVHAGGILISEQSIHHYTGTFLPPKGFPTTQFDMITAEDIGLYKFDILGQRGLAKIRD